MSIPPSPAPVATRDPRRPAPLIPAHTPAAASTARHGPSRPRTAPADSRRPSLPLLEPPARAPVVLRPLDEDCARLSALRGDAFSRDAIRLPGDPPPAVPAARRLAASAAIAVAGSPLALGALVENLLTGFRLG